MWEALSDKYRPDIVIIEYNPGLPNSHPIRVMKEFFDDPGHTLNTFDTGYYNANLNAIYDVARTKNYRFVTIAGWNAFFVRNVLYRQ